jgi:putative ABC transport system substrate-binding protein
MSNAINQLVAIGIAVLSLDIRTATPISAAQQPPITPKVQGLDPIKEGFATPLPERDRPDAATGAEVTRRRFDLLKEAVPGVTRVAVLWQPSQDMGGPMTALEGVGKAAYTTGLNLQFVAVSDISQLEPALSDIRKEDVDAVLVLSTRMLLLEREYVVQLLARTKLPAVFDAGDFVECGGLMSFGPNLSEIEQYNASHPGEITESTSARIDRPIKLELAVNLKTARKLGISFTPEFLMRVDKIIE